MCALIDKQLSIVRERHSTEAVSYLVLSGGLGSSRYVQNSIRARYEKGPGRALAGGEMQVLGSSEPQLAVCHGLVAARMQANMGGTDVFANRCCPVSFGILSRELYDPRKHVGEKVVQDPHDKRRWAEGQINWILKQVGSHSSHPSDLCYANALHRDKSFEQTTVSANATALKSKWVEKWSPGEHISCSRLFPRINCLKA